MKNKDIRNLLKTQFGSSCGMTGKRIFKSEKSAQYFGTDFIKNNESDTNKFRAYNCEYCGFWHLTKKV